MNSKSPGVRRFEELDIWVDSLELIAQCKSLIDSNTEFKRDFTLKDQLLRSCISVNSNIAEGFESGTDKQFMRYLNIAKASAGESRSQIFVAHKLGYISELEKEKLVREFSSLSARIYYFIKSLKTKHNS